MRVWFRRIGGILMLSVCLHGLTPSFGQEGQGIDAPDAYNLDIIGVPLDKTSGFDVVYEFTGSDTITDKRRDIHLTSTAYLRPDPAAFMATLTAEGDLTLFNLVPPEVDDHNTLISRQAYSRSGYYTHIYLPETNAQSCGKQTTGPDAASLKLDEQLPFPTDIFFANSVPPLPRVYPDGVFDEMPTARYEAEVATSILEGTFNVEILPDTHELIRFVFEGEGKFQAGDVTLDGRLTYRYQRVVIEEGLVFERPEGCQMPNVQGVPIFEPSILWVMRATQGEFTTNQTLENLLAYYDAELTPLGFTYRETFAETPLQTTVIYTMPNGNWVWLRFLDLGDEGLEVGIEIQTRLID